MRNNFFKSYPKFGHAPSKVFASFLGRKCLKNVGVKERPNVSGLFRTKFHENPTGGLSMTQNN